MNYCYYYILQYLQIPETQDEWREISNNFERKWNFPHCIGALDGKHVIVQKPINSGSMPLSIN